MRLHFIGGPGHRGDGVADLSTAPHRLPAEKIILASDGAYSATRAAIQFREGFNFSQDFLEHGYKELTVFLQPDGRHTLDPGSLHIWPRGGAMMIALPRTWTGPSPAPCSGPESGGGGPGLAQVAG